MTLLLSNEDVLAVIEPAKWIDALEVAFQDMVRGDAINRPRSMTYTPLGEGHWYALRSVDGSLPRAGVHAVRIGSDHRYEFDEGGKRRIDMLPMAPGERYVGLVLLFDINTLEPLAILQDGELQRWQVGCTSALVAKHLGRPDATVAGLIGSGWQAETQLLALAEVRQLREVRVYSTKPERVRSFCERLKNKVNFELRPAASAREAVAGAHLVVLATNSREPVIDGHWLEPGQHVNSIAPNEVDPYALERANLIAVRDRQASNSYHPPQNGPRAAEKDGFRDSVERKVVELGQIVSGRAGRISPEDITVFARTGQTSGLGVTFAAVAHSVFESAKAKGRGREFPTEWFTQTAKP